MKCEKLIRVIIGPIRKRLLLKNMSFKRLRKEFYEPQEARKRVFMSLNRLSKVFSEKERRILVYIS